MEKSSLKRLAMPYTQDGKNNTFTLHTNRDIFESVRTRIMTDQTGSSVIIPHVCNNINLFGAGFADALADKYPETKENYHLLGNSFLRNNLGYVQFIEVAKNQKYGHKLIIANMIAQNGVKKTNNPRPLNYVALGKCMLSVSVYARALKASGKENHSSCEIHAPKFGSGLAGGNWNFISDMIDDAWKDFNVFIYQHHK
jgi:hypothetical protein